MRLFAPALLAALASHTKLPAPDLALTVDAPSPEGPWTVRVENRGTKPLRIAADVRLLRLSLQPLGKGGPNIPCALPRAMVPARFPEARALYLEPGEAWRESFDPKLFCFGIREAVSLAPGVRVHARYGWREKTKGTPFVVEDLAAPSEYASLHIVEAPDVLIGPAKPVEAPEPAPAPLDEKAPRLALSVASFVDAPDPHALVLRVTAKNVGQRPMRAILRDRMLSFVVEGPNGKKECPAVIDQRDAAPGQLFRTIAAGATVSLPVRLMEACANDAWKRPGLYRVWASIHADETNAARGGVAFTGTAEAPSPALVRLASAPDPFYLMKPEKMRDP
jgi:hypothetical protein